MTDKLDILYVEDEEDQVEVVNDCIELYSENSPDYRITCDFAHDMKSALIHLLENNYDAAIIDLNLNGNTDGYMDGNKVIETITKKLRMPVVVRTGYPGKLDPNFENHPLIKVFTKDEDVHSIIEKVIDWHNSGFVRALGTPGRLEESLHRLFWSHFAGNIEEWSNSGLSPSENEKALLRFTINLLYDLLQIDDFGNFENFHPAEVFVMPSLKEDLFFADILKKNEKFYIILNPACDMAQKKFDSILLAEIVLFEEVHDFKSVLDAQIESSSKRGMNRLEKWMRNSQKNFYHFLPQHSIFPGGFIDFRKVMTVKDDLDRFEKIGSISSHFAKDIISRFNQYYSRQGQPSLDCVKILEDYTKRSEMEITIK